MVAAPSPAVTSDLSISGAARLFRKAGRTYQRYLQWGERDLPKLRAWADSDPVRKLWGERLLAQVWLDDHRLSDSPAARESAVFDVQEAGAVYDWRMIYGPPLEDWADRAWLEEGTTVLDDAALALRWRRGETPEVPLPDGIAARKLFDAEGRLHEFSHWLRCDLPVMAAFADARGLPSSQTALAQQWLDENPEEVWPRPAADPVHQTIENQPGSEVLTSSEAWEKIGTEITDVTEDAWKKALQRASERHREQGASLPVQLGGMFSEWELVQPGGGGHGGGHRVMRCRQPG
ncbi:MAG: hypothetical protein AAFX65_13730 [Cyanobacteria bacterium J06638_7]